MKFMKLVGRWKSEYVLSNGSTSEHLLSLKQREDRKITASGVNPNRSRVFVVLQLNPEVNTLTGTWEETTSKDGPYKGAIFFGAIQFLLSEGYDKAEGTWVGFNSKKTKVNSGPWTLTKL